MGNDGGSIPDRRDLVKSKPKAEQADKNNQMIAKWFFCALSKKPLKEPIVSDALGKLYNKEAIIEYLLDKTAYGDGEKICGHIKSLKDVTTLKLTPNPSKSPIDTDREIVRPKAQFICPLTLKEMTGGVPFVYLATCGDVFSAAGLRAVSTSTGSSEGSTEGEQELCPQCAKKFDRKKDVRTINPEPDEEGRMREAMIAAKAAKSSSKKRKAAEIEPESKTKDESKVDGNGTPSNEAITADSPDTKRPRQSHSSTPVPSTNPHLSSMTRKLAESLAEEEKKRKSHMSAAVASLYQSKDGKKTKETFLTMGTFTRYA